MHSSCNTQTLYRASIALGLRDTLTERLSIFMSLNKVGLTIIFYVFLLSIFLFFQSKELRTFHVFKVPRIHSARQVGTVAVAACFF